MGLLHKNHHHAAPPMASSNVHGTAVPVNAAGHAPVSNHHAPVSSHHAPGMNAHHPGPAPNTAGPHRHDLLNKLDPTVDSRSGGVQLIGPSVQPNAMAQQPMTAGAGNYTTAAPHHNSRVADTVDPRVDTRADRHVMHGADAGYSHHTTRMGDTVDPRMEPGLDHRAHGGMHGPASVPRGGVAQPGPATKTAGPHRSNLMNRLDPAVDHKATYSGAPQYRTA